MGDFVTPEDADDLDGDHVDSDQHGEYAESLKRIAEAQERQAEAMELAAGMMMLQYHYNEETVDFSSEALKEEALHFARGGEF